MVPVFLQNIKIQFLSLVFTSKYDDLGNPSTGIGLSYVKEMVEQLEGDVTIEDRTEGKGSIFIIRLGIDHIISKG